MVEESVQQRHAEAGAERKSEEKNGRLAATNDTIPKLNTTNTHPSGSGQSASGALRGNSIKQPSFLMKGRRAEEFEGVLGILLKRSVFARMKTFYRHLVEGTDL
jgi:hypothetical protein